MPSPTPQRALRTIMWPFFQLIAVLGVILVGTSLYFVAQSYSTPSQGVIGLAAGGSVHLAPVVRTLVEWDPTRGAEGYLLYRNSQSACEGVPRATVIGEYSLQFLETAYPGSPSMHYSVRPYFATSMGRCIPARTREISTP